VHFKRAYDYNGNPKYTEYVHQGARSELYGTQTGASPEGPADALGEAAADIFLGVRASVHKYRGTMLATR
jgi:hypothetical protein